MEEEVGKENETPNTNDNNIKKSPENPIKKSSTSCKGCLYYSSTLKSNDRNPFCVGISRSLAGVPHLVGANGLEVPREGRSLAEFKYGCVGYSVYVNGKDASVDRQQTQQAELPICLGLEALVGKKADAPDSVPAPAHPRNKEDSHGLPQPRMHQPSRMQGEEFMSKFSRNAGLVAMGVAKNLYRVGNHIKGRIDGILYPYRSRPK